MTYKFGWKTIPVADYEHMTAQVTDFCIFRTEVQDVLNELSGPQYTLDQIRSATTRLSLALERAQRDPDPPLIPGMHPELPQPPIFRVV